MAASSCRAAVSVYQHARGWAPVQRYRATRRRPLSPQSPRSAYVPHGRLPCGVQASGARNVRQTPTTRSSDRARSFRRTGNMEQQKSVIIVVNRFFLLASPDQRASFRTPQLRHIGQKIPVKAQKAERMLEPDRDKTNVGSDVARTHLALTSLGQDTEVSVQSPHEEASAPGACGVSCLHWASTSNRYA